MSALKTGLAITLAAFISAACTSAPQPANQNSNSAATAAPSPSAQPANTSAAAPSGATATSTNTDGAALYVAQKCAGCHGTDGKGKVKDARDFTDPAWQKKESDADLIAHIKKGSPPKMPAYEGKLNDAEIKSLVAYIRTFAR